MKKILYLIVIFCISEIAYSQSDFRDGFIINQNGDTTFGYISYKEGSTTYRNCHFKGLDNQNIVTYKAEDITGYGFKNDKYFQSKKIDTGGQDTEVVFLEVLISGKVSLYKYEKVFYIEKPGQEMLRLSNRTIESSVDGKKMYSQSKSYLGILNLFLSDSPELNQEKIYRTSFNEKSITNLVALYNKSMNAPMVIYKYNKPWVHARFGITGGLMSSNIALEASNSVLDHLGPFKRSNSPVYGATFEILSPRVNEHLSIVMDFLYSKSKYDSFNQHEIGGKTTKNYVDIELSHFKVPIGLKFSFGGKSLSSFVNFGLSETFTSKIKSDWTQTVEYITLFDTYYDEAIAIDKSQLGIWAGAGISKSISKGLSVYMELRYERTEGINADDYVALTKANVSNIQVTIGLTMR